MRKLAKAYNISCQALYKRISKGESIETILSTMKQRSQPIKGPDGKTYASMSELARAYGINPATLCNRLKHDVPIEKALIKPKHRQPIKGPDGKTYKSQREIAKAYGIEPSILKYKLKRGIKLENALTDETKTVKGPNGETYRSQREMARAYNISITTLEGRLKKGWPLEKALTAKTRGLPNIDDQMGNRFPTIKAMANYYMLKGRSMQQYGMELSIKSICKALKKKPNCEIIINGRIFKITEAKTPYLEIETSNEKFMMHLDKLLETYHCSTEFDPLVGLRRLKPKISKIRSIGFPYYDVVFNGVSKRMSYWDLMQEESKMQKGG